MQCKLAHAYFSTAGLSPKKSPQGEKRTRKTAAHGQALGITGCLCDWTRVWILSQGTFGTEESNPNPSLSLVGVRLTVQPLKLQLADP